GRWKSQCRRERDKALSVYEGRFADAQDAIARLAPLLDHVDMDGPLLLSEDIASGVQFDNGKILYTDKPGLGISIDPF
ncbi:MAG TPA: hypothetical protein PLA61_03885, partial [Ferruginibacter sp.]|nr:hypothetical protein [Ferruginibacter sp.]